MFDTKALSYFLCVIHTFFSRLMLCLSFLTVVVLLIQFYFCLNDVRSLQYGTHLYSKAYEVQKGGMAVWCLASLPQSKKVLCWSVKCQVSKVRIFSPCLCWFCLVPWHTAQRRARGDQVTLKSPLGVWMYEQMVACLYFSPLIDWGPVQGVPRLLPHAGWYSLQPSKDKRLKEVWPRKYRCKRTQNRWILEKHKLQKNSKANIV